jgi:hypothetical protein
VATTIQTKCHAKDDVHKYLAIEESELLDAHIMGSPVVKRLVNPQHQIATTGITKPLACATTSNVLLLDWRWPLKCW